MKLLKKLALTGAHMFASTLILACSSSDDVAGGVTDIGNSVADSDTILVAGKVIDIDGQPVRAARVIAYQDNFTALLDSVETITDSLGQFKIQTSKPFNMIQASKESLKGLQAATSYTELSIGSPKKLQGHFDGMETGAVRVAGTNLTAKIQPDGNFTLDSVPFGTGLQLVYLKDEAVEGSFTFTTADAQDALVLPTFETLTLHMDGTETVFDNDTILAQEVKYVEGKVEKAIALKPGQFIDLGSLSVTDGDFTISLWTQWKGPNENHQVLISERTYWSDSTSKFQWHFESNSGMFTVMKSMPKYPEALFFGDSSVVPLNKWTFMTLVSKDHMISMYINGIQVGETGEFVPNQLKEEVPFRIGGNEIDSETWNGLIDEVRIENFARSEDWIKSQCQ